MKIYFLSLVLFVMGSSLQAQEQDPWTVYMMPAEKHKVLEGYTGMFTLDITMWMNVGEEPQIFKVNSSNKMILGGRFLELTQTGNMGGMDFHAVTTIGYNNSDQNFSLVTITNMGTGILSLTGPWDDKSRLASLTGKLVNPVTKKPIWIRQTISFPDKDTIQIINYDQEEGATERKSVQYAFRRTH